MIFNWFKQILTQKTKEAIVIETLLTKLGLIGTTKIFASVQSIIESVESSVQNEPNKTVRNELIDGVVAVLTALKDK